jgi:hypothetical protein
MTGWDTWLSLLVLGIALWGYARGIALLTAREVEGRIRNIMQERWPEDNEDEFTNES